jgi:hypothetical protein
MGLLDYVRKSVSVAQDVAAAAKLISQAAPAMKSAMQDVEQAANLLRGDARREVVDDVSNGVQYPANVLHAAGVLGLALPATKADVEAAYKRSARLAHPDNTRGDTAAMVRVNLARKTMNEFLNPVSSAAR